MNVGAQRTSEKRLHNLTTTVLGGSANCKLPSWVWVKLSELLISLWDIVAKQAHMAFTCSPLSLNTRPVCYQIKALSLSHHQWGPFFIIVIMKNLRETKPCPNHANSVHNGTPTAKASQRDYCSGSAITGDRAKD
jgi:hypothetical protein